MQGIKAPFSAKRLRIAMLSIHSSPTGPLGTRDNGGMSVYVRELSRWLGRNGHHIDIFTCAGDNEQQTEIYPNVRLITIGEGRFSDIPKERLPDHLPRLFQAVDLFRQMHGLTYDVIHSHYWISGVVGAMAREQWHCPHLVMFHTLGAAKNSAQPGEHEPGLRIAHEQWLAVAADHIVAPSPQEWNNLTHLYHTPREKLSVIPCGVNLDLFRPVNRDESRRRLGLSLDAEMVLYVGRFAPLKALDTLIEAMTILRPNVPRLQLMIAGGDDPRAQSAQRLIHLARRLNMADVVRFVGCIDQQDLPAYYSAADVLALPSHYESFGLVVLEALACGTPVAATPVGVAAAIVREGVNGTIIARPDAQSVAQAIGRLLGIPAERRAPTHQVRTTAETYGWQGIAAAIARTYSTLIETYNPARTPPAQITSGVLPDSNFSHHG